MLCNSLTSVITKMFEAMVKIPMLCNSLTSVISKNVGNYSENTCYATV